MREARGAENFATQLDSNQERRQRIRLDSNFPNAPREFYPLAEHVFRRLTERSWKPFRSARQAQPLRLIFTDRAVRKPRCRMHASQVLRTTSPSLAAALSGNEPEISRPVRAD
ncbi:MAG: hypothetical protein B6A08_11510 [Sorangiineae bacterium NIC37A_2]|nr:MAG: hypothetical protein B6A08_11510 [Sorangiineae bacterium NIC37A_2]